MRIILFCILTLLIKLPVQSQMKVGGAGTPNLSSMLELESTNKGFIPPRIDLTSLTMPLNGGVPADGMSIYSINPTTGLGLFVWYNGRWNKMLVKAPESVLTQGRFIARGIPNVGAEVVWDPVFTSQPDGTPRLWNVEAPTKINIPTTGLYIISGSYRQEKQPQGNYSLYFGFGVFNRRNEILFSGDGPATPTVTAVVYLNAGETIAFSVYGIATQTPGATPSTSLGTTQFSISQLPLTY